MLVHVGHDNYLAAELVAVVLKPDSSPVKVRTQEVGTALNQWLIGKNYETVWNKINSTYFGFPMIWSALRQFHELAIT